MSTYQILIDQSLPGFSAESLDQLFELPDAELAYRDQGIIFVRRKGTPWIIKFDTAWSSAIKKSVTRLSLVTTRDGLILLPHLELRFITMSGYYWPNKITCHWEVIPNLQQGVS